MVPWHIIGTALYVLCSLQSVRTSGQEREKSEEGDSHYPTSHHLYIFVIMHHATHTASYGAKKLVGFIRTGMLSPGQSATVTIETDPTKMFTVVDEESGRRELQPGSYTLHLGDVLSPSTVKIELHSNQEQEQEQWVVEDNDWARDLGRGGNRFGKFAALK